MTEREIQLARALLWFASLPHPNVPSIEIANAVEQARAIVCVAEGGEIDPQSAYEDSPPCPKPEPSPIAGTPDSGSIPIPTDGPQ